MHRVIILATSIFLTSCFNNEVKINSIKSTNAKVDKNRSEGLKFYINEKYKKLELDKYDPCKSKPTIRIWYSYGVIDRLKMISLCINKSNLEAFYYEFNNRVIIHNGKFLTPKNGWANLNNKLIKSKIYNLPSWFEISNYGETGCGGQYTFETIFNNKQRIFTYWDPNSNQNKVWQAKVVQDFLTLIREEFNVEDDIYM